MGVTVLVEEKMSIYHAIELSLREIAYVLYAGALLRALMTQKSCAVGMRNGITLRKKFGKTLMYSSKSYSPK